MKKILIILGVILLSLLGILFLTLKSHNLSNNVDKNVKNTTKSVKIKVKNNDEKEDNKKESDETNPSVRENEENTAEKSSNEPQKVIQNDTNYTTNSNQNNSSSQSTSENVIQNNTQQNVVHEEQPQIDPNTTDTSHPLYSVHHGVIEYGNYSSCTNAGYNIQRQHQDMNLSHSCVEVYNISGEIKGYYLDITNEGRDANYLK